jgi:hypothetical protein
MLLAVELSIATRVGAVFTAQRLYELLFVIICSPKKKGPTSRKRSALLCVIKSQICRFGEFPVLKLGAALPLGLPDRELGRLF